MNNFCHDRNNIICDITIQQKCLQFNFVCENIKHFIQTVFPFRTISLKNFPYISYFNIWFYTWFLLNISHIPERLYWSEGCYYFTIKKVTVLISKFDMSRKSQSRVWKLNIFADIEWYKSFALKASSKIKGRVHFKVEIRFKQPGWE